MKFLAISAAAAAAGFIVVHATYAVQDVSQPVSTRESISHVGYSTGEIKKIDVDQGLVILKHGPIDNLGMPAMTMIFHLAKPEQGAAIKVGDLVRFKAEKVKGLLVITEITSLR